MLVIGLALGFVPQLRQIELPPETVLLLFLPAMLFWESLTTSLRAIRRDLRGIVILSTLLVVASAFAVAAVARLFGLPWPASLILGAALAPPDATAVAALGRALPRRNFMLLKAESLTNDGTALVVSAIAIGLATGEASYTPLSITGAVLLSYLGGGAAGIAVAALTILVLRRVRDALTINIALLVAPFTAYLCAELIGASGVTAGLVLAYWSPTITTAASRRQTESAWPLGSALLNGALFVLIGLQVQSVARCVNVGEIPALLATIVTVWLALLLVRFVFQVTSVTVIRLLDRRPGQQARRMSHRARVVSAVAGFRGAVSLAIALSVPVTTASGAPLPGRDTVIVVTAGVIVLTLLVQGPLLPVVVRWARLPDGTAPNAEFALAERTITEDAIEQLPTIAASTNAAPDVVDRLTREYRKSLARTGAASASQADDESGSAAIDAEDQLRLAVLARKRDVLLQLRRDGTIDDPVARQLQTRLDVEELPLTGIDDIDG
ncbi:Na+/H+ antiporter [Curtobacterium pusillum]|uniref:Na+/H+ antiporter n=1 Tax=Curtobacterium pusillum TaxID=69373 RepID=UPI0028D7ADF6|nr:Na+/H+ antiporter [Curtobacterium pusillum]